MISNMSKREGEPGKEGSWSQTSYGGQAVIEGVMMRGRDGIVLSVRTPTGDIVSLEKDVPAPYRKKGLASLPVVRGALALWDSLSLGIEMLMKSAEIAAPQEVKPTKAAVNLSVALAVVVAVGLFIILPGIIAPWILGFFGVSGRIWISLLETALRMLILFGYVLLISRMDEIQRVLQYHGAEHKVVWAWEKNWEHIDFKDLKRTIDFLSEKARPESTLHPRCGTSFLFIAVICTWVVFLFITPGGLLLRVVARLALLPLVAGISYEVLKASAGRTGRIWKLVSLPGLLLQKLTTREPDPDQIQVAATSLGRLVLKERGDLL